MKYRIIYYLTIIIIGGLLNDYQFNYDLIYLKHINPRWFHDLFVKDGWPFINFSLHLIIHFCFFLTILVQNRMQPEQFNLYHLNLIKHFIHHQWQTLLLFIIVCYLTQESFDLILYIVANYTVLYQSINNLINNFFHYQFQVQPIVIAFQMPSTFNCNGKLIIVKFKFNLKFKFNFVEIEAQNLINSANTIWSTVNLSPMFNYHLKWTSSTMFFDISGHVHVLIMSNLMLLKQLNQLQQFLIEQLKLINNGSDSDNEHLCTLLIKSDPLAVICLIFSLIAWTSARFILLIWDLILIQTILFYHTTLEKLLSFIWTIICIKFILLTLCKCQPFWHTIGHQKFNLISMY